MVEVNATAVEGGKTLFGSNGIIGPITLLIGAGVFLGASLFRKNVANDALGMPFSLIGSSASGVLGYILIDNIFNSVKWGAFTAIVGMMIAGFLIGDLFGDGEA